ncbi:MAG: hypothetical protein QM626_06060 [Microbacterium sp.]|uniref:hypothetical protein n=1 Tax=Microbacterium sp. TaxID=51671 RepID=UPI0039E62E7E
MHRRPNSSHRLRGVLGVVGIAAVVIAGFIGTSSAAQATTADSVTASTAASGIVQTADLSQFQAGNIISDTVFYDSSTMSQSQVQGFLNSKVSSCKSGYTCLKSWTGPSSSQSANAMCSAFSGSSSETAASLIYKVAQACGINPQVLLVMIQKEQGLVTSTAPSTYAYNYAMGYNCPDTTGCTSDGLGFATQVYGGAYMLKRYSNPTGTSKYFTWYAPGNTWNILYNPSTSCGSSAVYIQNQATANLYYYTPYQPNAAALAAGYGTGDSCSAYGNRNFYNYFTDWFGSTQGSVLPIGSVDEVVTSPGSFTVRGWAADPDTADSISVHIYVGSSATSVVADQERPDVAAVYPTLGSDHGFQAVVSATGSSPVDVCVFAIDSENPDQHTLLQCRTLDAMTGAPTGSIDSFTTEGSSATISGWALDPDSTGSVTVRVAVDDEDTDVIASSDRPDLAPYFPAYGTAHGYSATVVLPPGTHQVCVSVLNVGAGSDTSLGCRSASVEIADDQGLAPFGAFDTMSVSGTSALIRGWAIDPDTTGPIAYRVTVNGVATTYTASFTRPDVGAVYPAYGAKHGFEKTIDLPNADAEVCVTAINTDGADTYLGCRNRKGVIANRLPVGSVDAVEVSPGVFQVRGWAADPDTIDPIPVHIWIGNSATAVTADGDRPDVAAAFTTFGAAHGFSATINANGGGTTQICIFAIDTDPDQHTLLKCVSVNAMSGSPIGSFDTVRVEGGTTTITGWAIDPDTVDPVTVVVTVDGSENARLVAEAERPDLASYYPAYGTAHGYVQNLQLGSGRHTICVSTVNVAAGADTSRSCKTVDVP